MDDSMKFVKLSILSCFVLFSCQQADVARENGKTNSLFELLIGSDFFKITEDLFLVIRNNELSYISTLENGFSDDSFMLHYIREDQTFINSDFLAKNVEQDSIVFENGKKWLVMNIQLEQTDYVGLRTGQYRRDSNGTTNNLWVKQLPKSDLGKGKFNYKDEVDKILDFSLQEEKFAQDLKTGVFFENPFGFCIVLVEKNLYMITPLEKEVKDKIMLHFVNEDYSFENRSFSFNNFRIDSYFKKSFKNIKVTKVQLPNTPYVKIRFGQFTPQGNKWTQEVLLKDLLSNPLLRYQGELSKEIINEFKPYNN